MQNILFIVNDSPYSGEKTFNAVRFAINMKEEHSKDVNIKLCTSCVKARGLLDAKLIDGVTLGTLDDVSEWTLWADKVLTF